VEGSDWENDVRTA